jgi:ABC-2 type transport system ATP-binding protein
VRPNAADVDGNQYRPPRHALTHPQETGNVVTPGDPPAVAIRQLTLTFGDFTAVDHATADIAPGEVVGVIAPNGAGKSTLIKMLTTLLPPTSGTALIAGHDIVREPAEVRRHIGYVPQPL